MFFGATFLSGSQVGIGWCRYLIDTDNDDDIALIQERAIHSTKISGNFGPKLNGSVWSNQKSFGKTGPPFEVDHFSRSDRLECWLNGSRPVFPQMGFHVNS